MTAQRLLLATANRHKLEEYAALLAGLPTKLMTLVDVNLNELPEESGATFEENALIKARACAHASGLLSLADDSGIEVDALGGFPGIHSNRWAGHGKSDADRVRLLLERLETAPDPSRTARFVCVVAVVTPEGGEHTFPGYLDGELAREPRGAGGFGYDPIFYVPELQCTVAELSSQEKNRVSHRARAVQAALPWLQEYLERRSAG